MLIRVFATESFMHIIVNVGKLMLHKYICYKMLRQTCTRRYSMYGNYFNRVRVCVCSCIYVCVCLFCNALIYMLDGLNINFPQKFIFPQSIQVIFHEYCWLLCYYISLIILYMEKVISIVSVWSVLIKALNDEQKETWNTFQMKWLVILQENMLCGIYA